MRLGAPASSTAGSQRWREALRARVLRRGVAALGVSLGARRVLHRGVAELARGLAGALAGGHAPGAATRPPEVVVVLVDDLGWHDVRVRGQDGRARAGMRFVTRLRGTNSPEAHGVIVTAAGADEQADTHDARTPRPRPARGVPRRPTHPSLSDMSGAAAARDSR